MSEDSWLVDDNRRKDEEEETRRQLLCQPVYLFSTYLASCYYDKAREIADKERDNHKNAPSSSSYIFYSVLSQLTMAEKQYMSLAYLAPKRFLMKETSLSNHYTHLYNEICRLDDKVAAADTDSEILTLSSQIKNFIKARITLVDFFDRLSASGVKAITASQVAASPLPQPPPANTANTNTASVTSSGTSIDVGSGNGVPNSTMMPIESLFVPGIEEINSIYGSSLQHRHLYPLDQSFILELKAIKSLLGALRDINRWRYYEALMALDQGRQALAKWSELISTSSRGVETIMSSSSKLTFFGSFMGLRSSSNRSGGNGDQVEPVLHDWLMKLKTALHCKFTLYFYEILLAQTTLADMRERCSKLSIDYASRIVTFQRRVDATAISLVFDATSEKNTYMGPGYHHPDRQLATPLQGLDLYPAPFTCPIVGTSGSCIPQDEVARHWACIVKIIKDYSRELDLPDKIVYIFDKRLENTYYLLRIDPQMFMVVIFERSKMEKDPLISGFLLEIAGLLRCTRVFASLKPGFK